MRPRLPPEPEPQGGAAAEVPLLVMASLAGGDAVDATTVSYLLKVALVKKREEEEKRRVKKEQAEDEALEDKLEAEEDALLAIGRLTSRQEARLSAVLRERVEVTERMKRRRATMKKRKKRKKRKLAKSSSFRAVRTWKPGRSSWSPLPSCPCSVSSWCSLHSGYLFIRQSWWLIWNNFTQFLFLGSHFFGVWVVWGVQDYWMFLGDVDSARIQRSFAP